MSALVIVNSKVAARPSRNLHFYAENQEAGSNAVKTRNDVHLYEPPVDLDLLIFFFFFKEQLTGPSVFYVPANGYQLWKLWAFWPLKRLPTSCQLDQNGCSKILSPLR